MAVYLYAVVQPDLAIPGDVDLVEPALGQLRLVEGGRLAALAADYGAPKVAMSAANLRAHHEVVERAAERGGVLPVQFGVVFESDDSLREDVLVARESALVDLLRVLTDHVEMRVTTTYVEDAALREAVAGSRQLRALDRGILERRGAGYHDRIALGELAMHEVVNIRERDLQILFEYVGPTVGAHRVVSAGVEGSVRTAFLVQHQRLDAFEDALEEFAVAQTGRMAVELVGPIAAWDFAEIDPADGADVPESPVAAGR